MQTCHWVRFLGNGAMCMECEWDHFPEAGHRDQEVIKRRIFQHHEDTRREMSDEELRIRSLSRG